MKRENSPRSALSLLIAAFDGMPVRGRRELRLSPHCLLYTSDAADD